MAKLHSASPREITSPFTLEFISELHSNTCNWASEASPTLGCSIEISRDIYILCVSVVCQITWNHVNQTRACSKSVLGGKICVIFVSTIR